MEIKQFERMICDSVKDIQQGKFPEELNEVLHFVNTFERLEIETSKVGIQIILNDGSKFNLFINWPEKCGQ
ncbi:hypothetical protein [Virgibacillus salinus]|uniref:Uncharacterized protein n=1 Tax=Virgibacillus salinus TaxID=553311 RepID=A0A1H0XUN1_9BACI|nr:hypothetical protein [Virgibacillus salinus]SDQ06575.1 hypothetical protein SAMN05216231_0218 [Virgibacillus salinus]